MDKLRNKAVLNSIIEKSMEQSINSFSGQVDLNSLSLTVVSNITDVSKYSLEEIIEKTISAYFYSCVFSDEDFEDFYIDRAEDVRLFIREAYKNKL